MSLVISSHVVNPCFFTHISVTYKKKHGKGIFFLSIGHYLFQNEYIIITHVSFKCDKKKNCAINIPYPNILGL